MNRRFAADKEKGCKQQVLLLAVLLFLACFAFCSNGAEILTANIAQKTTAAESTTAAETVIDVTTPEGSSPVQENIPAFEKSDLQPLFDSSSAMPPVELSLDMEIGFVYEQANLGDFDIVIADFSNKDESFQGIFYRQKDETKLLFSLNQSKSVSYNISYTDGSFEQSGGNYLYFSIQNARDKHYSLYCFDVKAELFACLFEAPCSNMVLDFAHFDGNGIGWVLHENDIVAIDLATASVCTEMKVSLGELGKYPDIADSFFVSNDAAALYKFAMLEAVIETRIPVLVLEMNLENVEFCHFFEYDFVSKTMYYRGMR